MLVFVVSPLLVEVLANAAAGVAAHHGLRTVGVEDAHAVVGISGRRTADEHETVAADTEMWTAPLAARL